MALSILGASRIILRILVSHFTLKQKNYLWYSFVILVIVSKSLFHKINLENLIHDIKEFSHPKS